MSQTEEFLTTRGKTERIVKIKDSHYQKVDLEKIANEANDLDSTEQQLLSSLLIEFDDIFDSTLGEWNTELIELKLKPDQKPDSAIHNLVPKINKTNF